MIKLILVRHGVTEWNKSLRYQGHSDIPLSEIGRGQAKALSERLAKAKIDAFYASDLSRAKETAEIIASPHHEEVKLMSQYRETKFGEWEGLTYNEIIEKFPREMADWRVNPTVTRIPGGETLNEVAQRCMSGINEIKAEHEQQTVLLVAHGGIIRIIISSLIGINLNEYWKIQQDNTALNIIEIHDDKSILCLLNDTNHLNIKSL